MIVPHEQLERYKEFKVHTMSSLITHLNMQGHYRSSEHSILQVTLQTDNVTGVNCPADSLTAKQQYKLCDILASFLNCETSFQRLTCTLERIETSLNQEQDVQLAYTEFVKLVTDEMDAKLPKRKQYKTKTSYKPHKSRVKPYWTSELQDLWNEVCKRERIWLVNKRCVNSRSLREDFRKTRRRFDKLNRQCKRKYQVEQQK